MSDSTGSQSGGGLLEGLRVVEIGRRIAAPLAGMLLAEQGAEVVRIAARPDGPVDPVLDAMLARGKTESYLDLEKPSDVAIVQRLLRRADVVLENERTGRLDGLEIRFEEIRKGDNPGLISCSVPSFPAGDPRCELPDHEAAAGMAGFLYHKPLGRPLYHDFPVGSVMAGLFTANAVVAALIARLKVGQGQHIDTCLFHSNLFAQILQVLIKTGVPRGFLPLKMIGTPFMSSWLCRDDRYIYLHITLPTHNARILEILEENGYAADVGKLRTILSPATMRDPSQVGSIPEAKRIRKAYEGIFRTRAADEWENLLGQELCCIKVRTVEEWMRDSRDAGMTDVCTIDDPVFGELIAPGATVTSEAHPPRIRARSRDTGALDEILTRWEKEPLADGVGAANASDPALAHPLEGIRVLDISRVIAGPCAARVLAEFGAEVISVQNPTGLDWALSFHLLFNAGKKSVTLDSTTEAGKKKLWALLEHMQPHAFIQNYRHLDVARSIGVDPEAVCSRFPSIVYTHLNAYGNEGGWRDRPGFEQVVQAVTGIQMAYGRRGRPRLLPTPVIDIGSGLSGAFATLLGLYHQEKTGKGVFSATHLTSTAVLLQLNRVVASQREECLRNARAKGQEVAYEADSEGEAAILRALDGYACVAGSHKDLCGWLQRGGVASRAQLSDGDPLEIVGRHFVMRRVSGWQKSLIGAGARDSVTITAAGAWRTLVSDIQRFDRSSVPVVRKREYPGCPTELTFVRSPVNMSLTPMVDVAPPPVRGADTKEVLEGIGEEVAPQTGVVPYPENKPILVWAASFVRWGYFAWRSGNI